MKIKLSVIFTLLISVLLINSCRTYKYIDWDEPYEYVYTRTIDYPNKDTIAVITLRNDTLNGAAKMLKIPGPFKEKVFDIIYNDALYHNIWTYGNYVDNKKNGQWYCLDDENNVILQYNYENDILMGDFFTLHEKDTLYKGTYHDGVLHGDFFINHNGYNLQDGKWVKGKYRWELNYNKGKLDGLQLRYFDSEIVEEILFDNGRVLKIMKSPGLDKVELDEYGSGFIQFTDMGLAFGILGQQFNKTHTDIEHIKIFGDGSYTGRIDFCNGYFCPKKIKLKGLPDSEYIFTIEYETKITKEYIKK